MLLHEKTLSGGMVFKFLDRFSLQYGLFIQVSPPDGECTIEITAEVEMHYRVLVYIKCSRCYWISFVVLWILKALLYYRLQCIQTKVASFCWMGLSYPGFVLRDFEVISHNSVYPGWTSTFQLKTKKLLIKPCSPIKDKPLDKMLENLQTILCTV